MTILNKPKTMKIDNALFKDISLLQREIERKTCCAVSFRKASELYAKTNIKKVIKVNVNGNLITIQRRT
jgi:hypothetical protein